MDEVKELAKWLKEEVEFLKANQDYVGGWYQLGNGLAATVLWEQGWGDEIRDDAIQADGNPDWALCAGILVYNKDDTPDGWFMPWDSETGDIICETTGIIPNEDYEKLAKWLLEDYDRVKDADIKPNGETIFPKEEAPVEQPEEEPEIELEKEVEVEEESLKEGKEPDLPKEVEVSIGEVNFDGDFIDLEDDEISDLLSDYLSDTYGFCHKGFKWKGKENSGDTLICYDIEWDTSESCKKSKKEPIKENKQMINESKEFSTSPYKDIIAEHFDYSGDFEFLDVVASIIGRVSNFEDDEDIWTSIDDELIYTYDQWKVLEEYCTPQDANWEVAFESLCNDIFSICATIAGTNGEDDEVEVED